jgi:allophanate hydrolase subunit 2
MSLVVSSATGPITLQDLGRPGYMHEGVPPGGAIVPTRMIAANRAVGNRDNAVAIEVLGLLSVRAETRIEVATPEGARVLDAGEHLQLHSASWTYLAVRGGITQPLLTLVPTRVHSGMRIAPGREPRVQAAPPPVLLDDPVRVIVGPDLDAFEPNALDVLLSDKHVVTMPARSGARLVGVTLPRRASYREVSRPMVRGAIEVARDGKPIVLGPDHPTIGGYPVIAVIATDDVERVFALPSVRFSLM